LSTIPLVPDSITANDPRLFTTLQRIDPAANWYAPPTLQHGLTRDDSTGRIQIKPEIAAELEPKTLARANRLLAADRASEANSLAGCSHIHNVTSHCAAGHEAEHSPVVCGKPMLHEPCAAPKARISKFRYEHPRLHAHLAQSSIQVFTFELPDAPGDRRSSMVRGRELFRRFANTFDGEHGWQWLAAFTPRFDGTMFHVIHEGDRLPYWPELNALWKRIAGPAATLRVRTYDDRDGDTQETGLRLANSGFVAYWESVGARELELSAEFRNEDLTALYGTFRGFEHGDGETIEEDAPELPTCSVCGRRHIRQHMLATVRELAERFDHIRPTSYGQRQRATMAARRYSTVSPSPPPW
jgi:hypothetical protein